MRPEYAEWIEAYVAKQPSRFVRGKCNEATALMVDAFPELRRACGFVYCTWGEDQHWWCVTPDGAIVDPTKSQFVLVYEYEEIDPDKDRDRIPTGKCMNCGDYTYAGKQFCCEGCESATIDYLENGWE